MLFSQILYLYKGTCSTLSLEDHKKKNNSSIYYVSNNLRKWTIRPLHDREYQHLTNSSINISNKQFQHSWLLKTSILTNRLNILDLLQIFPSSEIVTSMIIGLTCLRRTKLGGVMGGKPQSPTGRPCVQQFLACSIEKALSPQFN